jgi:hypothetical protein
MYVLCVLKASDRSTVMGAVAKPALEPAVVLPAVLVMMEDLRPRTCNPRRMANMALSLYVCVGLCV